MTIVINKLDLPSSDIGWEFQGAQYADTNISFLIIDAPPGSGPALHSHPYEEIFIVQEGQATLTVGGATIEATSGQIVIVPAGVPHKFVNSGSEPLDHKQICWPQFPAGPQAFDLTTVICPCRYATITLNGAPLLGEVQTSEANGWPASSAFLAFAETWVGPVAPL